MSQENVEIMRRVNGAFNRGDIERLLAFYSQDVEIEDLMNAPDVPSVLKGIEAFRQMITAWVEAFDEFNTDVIEYIDRGRHVVLVTDYHGKSREGLAMHLRVADVAELEGGKIVRATFGYESRERALEAVGLPG